MNQRFLARILAAASCCVATAALAQGPDELWEVTSRTEMAGMSLPASTTKVCKPKGDRDPSRMAEKDKNSDCKMTDLKQSGNRSTWKVVCTKPEPMTGTGDFTYSGDKYDGTMKMSGKMEGESFTMTQHISGKKVGSCTYEEPSKQVERMQAQTQAMIDKECDNHIAELNPGSIFGGQGVPEEALICKHRKKDFCAATTKATGQIKDEASFAQVDEKYRNWREAAKACNMDPNTVAAPACKSALGKKDYRFLAANCPVESRALAHKHCAGMDYTAIMASEYHEVCRNYAGELAKMKVGEGKSESKAEAAPEQPKSDKNKTLDAVKEGGNKLKKLLKF